MKPTALSLSVLGLLLVFLAYSNHFENAFHFDDSHTIQNNLYIQDLSNVPRFFIDPSTSSSLPSNQGYRPLITTSLAIDYWLGQGLAPDAFHRSMFVIFLLQLFAMFMLYRVIFSETGKAQELTVLTILAVTFYGVHTANAETINYIIARSDSYSAFFIILGLVLHALYPTSWQRHLSLIAVAAGMLCKEATIVFPALLFAFQIIIKRQTFRLAIKATLPSALLCAFLALFAVNMAQSADVGGGPRLQYLLTQAWVITHYLSSYLLPLNLSADTDLGLIANHFDPRIIVGSCIVLALLLLAVRLRQVRQYAPISFGIFWFFITLAPTSSFLPLAEVMNDHRTFLPYVGLNLAVCWSLYLAVKSHLAKPVVRGITLLSAAVAILGHSYGTWQRNKVWKTEESLWLDVTQKSPLNPRGLMNYGLTQMAKGQYDTALEFFERALPLAPNYAFLHINLGVVHGAMGNSTEAERYFLKARALQPKLPDSYSYHARWLTNQGRAKEAEALLLEAIRLSPGNVFSLAELERARQALTTTDQQ